MIDSNLLARIENLTDSKLREDCLRILNNTKNGSSIINFRYRPIQVVELYELCDMLSLSKTVIIKGSIDKYKKQFKG